jgi:hypothetical protein
MHSGRGQLNLQGNLYLATGGLPRESAYNARQKTGTMLWIEHDFVSNAKLKKSPSYYD